MGDKAVEYVCTICIEREKSTCLSIHLLVLHGNCRDRCVSHQKVETGTYITIGTVMKNFLAAVN